MRLVPTYLAFIMVSLSVGQISALADDTCRQDCGFRNNIDRTYDGQAAFRGADAWNRWEAYQKCLERCEEKSDSTDDQF
jgi:hypothetical protein